MIKHHFKKPAVSSALLCWILSRGLVLVHVFWVSGFGGRPEWSWWEFSVEYFQNLVYACSRLIKYQYWQCETLVNYSERSAFSPLILSWLSLNLILCLSECLFSPSFFFPHPSPSLLPSFIHSAMLPPYFCGRGTAVSCRAWGWPGGLAAGSTELEHWAHCLTHTHISLSLAHKPHGHIHYIHLKARQEGVGSWTHWDFIEVYPCELWHLEL